MTKEMASRLMPSGVFVFRSNYKRKVVMWSLTEQVDGPETDAIDVGRCVDFGKFRDGHLGFGQYVLWSEAGAL